MKIKMSQKILLFLLLFTLFIPAERTFSRDFAAGHTMGQYADPFSQKSYPYVKLLESSDQGVLIEFTPPRPEFTSGTDGNSPCQRVDIAGLESIQLPQLPALPIQGVMLGVPSGSQPTINILEMESETIELIHDLCLVSYPNFQMLDLQGLSELEGVDQPINNPEFAPLAPSSPVELLETGMLRSQPFAKLQFNPILFDQDLREIQYYSRLRIQLYFNAPVQLQRDQDTVLEEPYFEEIFNNLLINDDQAVDWRGRPQETTVATSTDRNAGDFYKIETREAGIYQVSYADLDNLGADVGSIDTATFQLFNQSTEVAIKLEDGGDGSFDPGDVLLFYGEPLQSKYSDVNVYWLTWGAEPGLRMNLANGESAGVADTDFVQYRHFETDAFYLGSVPSGPDMDHWYWKEVYASSGPDFEEIPFTLTNLSPETRTATIRGHLKGYSANPNHHTLIYLNGILQDDHTFASGSEYNFEFTVDQSELIEGVNILKIECPRDGDITLDDVLFNWFEVDYYAAYMADNDRLFFSKGAGDWTYVIDGFSTNDIEFFDTTNPKEPELVDYGGLESTPDGFVIEFRHIIPEEHQYLVQTTSQRLIPLNIYLDTPSDWKTTAHGADYILITHQDFLSAVQPLADYRASQGYRVKVVDVQDLFDEFNAGLYSPEAIKSFLEYAYHNWAGDAPSFVLLVGDGHYDYKDNLGRGESNFIPPYLDDVDPWISETATDNRYVSVSGEDILPDMHIGRFAVKTLEEAQAVVQRTITYEQSPEPGDWNLNQIFLADDADSGGNYANESEEIIALIPSPPNNIERIFYKVNYADIGDARSAFMTAFNQGSAIVQYAGHGATQQWANPYLLRLQDFVNFTNGSKLPFILALTCSEGYFIHPSPTGADYSSVGESITRMTNHGAIASWSPTGFGLTAGHTKLSDDLTDNLFNQHMNQLGLLTTLAKYHLYQTTSGFNDLIETYVLFGDPATRLNVHREELEPPSDLVASAVAFDQIDLTWTDNSDSETEFLIERSLNGTDGWAQIGSVDANVTEFSDTDLEPGTPYYYRVRAYRSGDLQYSDYSNIATATTNELLKHFLPLIVH
jgi:hypothetical protein